MAKTSKKKAKPRKKQSGPPTPHSVRQENGQIRVDLYLIGEAAEAFTRLLPKYESKTAVISDALIE